MNKPFIYLLFLFVLVFYGCRFGDGDTSDKIPSWFPGVWGSVTSNGIITESFSIEHMKDKSPNTLVAYSLDSAGNKKPDGVRKIIMSETAGRLYAAIYDSVTQTSGFSIYKIVKTGDDKITLYPVTAYSPENNSTPEEIKSYLEKNTGNDNIYDFERVALLKKQ